jgi:hypothetical protein
MQPVEPQPPVLEEAAEPRVSWLHRLGTLLFILVCFEVGVFLLVFPWMDYWSTNWIAGISPWIHAIWVNAFFRGALSGLGLLNIYISLAEVFRLRRPAADRLKVSTL